MAQPFSFIVRTEASLRTRITPMTWSSARRSIPFTPWAVLPMIEISFSSNRIARPFLVSSITWALSSDRTTSMIASSSLTPAAITPPALGLENSSRPVRFTTPLRETNSRTLSSASSSSTATRATIRSFRSALVSA